MTTFGRAVRAPAGSGGHQPSDSGYVRPTTPSNSGFGMLMPTLWHLSCQYVALAAGPQAGDDVLEHGVAELVGDLLAVDHPALHERARRAARWRCRGRGRGRSPRGAGPAGAPCGSGAAARRAWRARGRGGRGRGRWRRGAPACRSGTRRASSLSFQRSKIVRRSSRRSPVSGVGSSTKHDVAAATTIACFDAEVAVEGGLGHAGPGRHLVEGDALHAAGEQELDGGVERGLPRLFAAGSCHRYEMVVESDASCRV